MEGIEQWTSLAPSPRPLAGEDKWNVFLSYRSVNRAWVLNLYDVLRGHGHAVFLDQVTIKAGDPLIRVLEEGLQTSQAGVLVWSTAAADSEWVRNEYEAMDHLSKAKPGFLFVPVRLDAHDLPLFAANRVFLDFSAYPDGPGGGELLRLLHAVVGEPLSEAAVRFAAEQDEAASRAMTRVVAAIRNGDSERLQSLYQASGLPWRTSAALGSRVAEGLIDINELDAAITILTDLETRFPRAIRPRQLHALALARRRNDGDLSEAQAILGELYEGGQRDPETVGIYARTWMDRYDTGTRVSNPVSGSTTGPIVLTKDPKHLRRSRDLYAEAFQGAQDDYYTGINAASKSVFMGEPGDLKEAAAYAERVQEIVGTEPVPGDYWQTATVGELFLIRKDFANAARLYGEAVAMAPDAHGMHRSTWKQACRLMDKLQPSEEDRSVVRRVFAHLPDC